MTVKRAPLKIVRSQKLTATLVAISFACLNIFNVTPPVFAQTQPLTHSFSSTKDFKLPEGVARIDSRIGSINSAFHPQVVLIQDAHGIPEAQKSIQKILRHLDAEYGLAAVALEGASGPLDPTLLKTFPDQGALERVMQRYLDSGELSGAVVESVLGTSSADYMGIEDPALYEEGLKAYWNVLDARQNTYLSWVQMNDQLSVLKKQIYTPELLAWDESSRGFESGTWTLDQLLVRMTRDRVAGRGPVFQKQYPHLALVLDQWLAQTEHADGKTLREISELRRFLKARLKNAQALKKLNTAGQAFDTEQMSASAFGAILVQLLREARLSHPVSSSLEKAFYEQQQLDRLKTRDFDLELRQWIRASGQALMKNDAQRFLAVMDQRMQVLARYMRCELSEDSWTELKQWQTLTGLPPELQAIASRMDVFTRSLNAQYTFYQIAQKRDQALFQRFSSVLTVHQNLPGITVLIAGGFHSQALQQHLQAAGVSVAVVSPFAGEVKEKTSYEDLMRGNVSWKNYFKVQDGRINLFEAFSRAVRDQLFQEAVHDQAAKDSVLKEWQDRLLRALYRQGRITEAGDYLMLLEPSPAPAPVKMSWKNKVMRLCQKLQRMKESGAWNQTMILHALASATMMPSVMVPLVRTASLPAGNREAAAAAAVRAETRLSASTPSWVEQNTQYVSLYTMISRQFETGLHDGILEAIFQDPNYGPTVMRWIAQSQMTGGLGALMHDLADAWKLNGADVIMMNNLYELSIKGSGIPEEITQRGETLGSIMRKFLDPTDIRLEFMLKADDEFRQSARGTKAEGAIGKKIYVEVFSKPTKIAGTPSYYFYVYYFNEAGERVPVMDELYPDNKPTRALQMVVYNTATQALLKALQERGLAKQNVLYVNNEVYVSLPTADGAPRHDLNHSVVSNTIPKLDPAAYRFAGLPREDHDEIIRDGELHLTEVVGLYADSISAVSLFEHGNVLEELFAPFRHKVQGYNVDGVRSTNGALFEKWQSPERRQLLREYKQMVGIDPKERDDRLFNRLNAPEQQALREQYKAQNEWIAGKDVALLLNWLAATQSNSSWRSETMKKYRAKAGAAAVPGSDEEILTGLSRAVSDASRQGFQNPSPWQALEERYGVLLDVLMDDPAVSNVRRQVPYKGPVAWEEIVAGNVENQHELNAFRQSLKNWEDALQNLAGHPERVRDFRENIGRILIGGRTFDHDSWARFQRIRGLVAKLGLEDRIATITNYNNFEAPLIFRAVAGSVMLSHEFLEASATSMMKALCNYGVLIGVWGGADPELFTIVDENGAEIDPFKYISEKGIKFDAFHDILVPNLRAGKWKITNGFLVEYSSDRNGTQKVGARQPRKPATESLVQALRGLRNSYRTRESRRNLQWEVSRSSWKTDMERGQARAHIKIWDSIIERREKAKTYFAGLNPSASGSQKVLAITSNGFWFSRDQHPPHRNVKVEEVSSSGILEFFAAFHRLRAKGEPAFWSVLYHAGNHHGLGDFIRHLRDYLKPVKNDPTFEPIFAEIQKFAWRIRHQTTEEARARINLEFIDFMERVIQRMAYSIFEAYLTGDPGVRAGMAKNFKDAGFRKMLIRYLDQHPEAAQPLSSTSERIKLYAVSVGQEKFMVAVNVDEFQFWPVREGEEAKAWTRLYGADSVKTLLGEDADHHLSRVYRTQDLVTGQMYNQYPVWRMRSQGVPVGINGEMVHVVRFVPTAMTEDKPEIVALKEELPEMLRAAIAGEFINDATPPAELIEQIVRDNRQDPAKLREILGSVVALPADQAKKVFGEENTQLVMAFVAALAPQLLPGMRGWDGDFYTMLETVVNAENTRDIFSKGEIDFHVVDRSTSMVISRSFAGRRIFIPIHFSKTHYRILDSKIWFRALDLSAFDLLAPDDAVRVRDYTLKNAEQTFGVDYPNVQKGQSLLRSWAIGVSMVPGQKDASGLVQHGGRFQIVEFIDEKTGQPLLKKEKPAAGSKTSGRESRSELRQTTEAAVREWARTGKVVEQAPALAGWFDRDFQQTVSSLQKAAEQMDQPGETRVREFLSLQRRSGEFAAEPSLDHYAEQLRSYLEVNPQHQLHYAWMMPAPEDAQVRGWMAGFLTRLRQLSAQYPGRVSAQIGLIASGQTQDADWAQDFPDMVKVISGATEMNQFLALHSNALYHGLSDRLAGQIRQDLAFRNIGFSNIGWQDVFPLLTVIYFMTAQQSGELTAEELQQLPQAMHLDQLMGFDHHLVIYQAAREWMMQARAEQIIATMA